jgi:hypothetical protein
VLRSKTDAELATECRDLRNKMRPVMDELRRRGYDIFERHGHSEVPVTGFENIIIDRQVIERL